MGHAPRSATIRLGVISDPHMGIGETEQTWKLHLYNDTLLRDHLRLVQETPGVEFILIPGDLTKDSEPWNHEAMRKILGEQSLPVFVIPGNHDVRKLARPAESNWGINRFAPFYEGFGPDGVHPYFSRDLKPDLHLVALNTADTPDERCTTTWGGRVDDDQLAWLEADLAANRHKRCIVMTHHSVLPHTRADMGTAWRDFMMANRAEVLDILHRNGVEVVLSGHHHVNHIAEEDGLWEITTAGAGSYPSVHRIVELRDDSLHTWVVNHPNHRVAVDGLREMQYATDFNMPSGTWEELATLMHGAPEHRERTIPLRRKQSDLPET